MFSTARLFTSFLTLIQLAAIATASPQNKDTVYHFARALDATPNNAVASPSAVVVARQLHNADYGSNSGPGGDPQPNPAETSSAPSPNQTAPRLRRSSTLSSDDSSDGSNNEGEQYKRHVSSTAEPLAGTPDSYYKRDNPSDLSEKAHATHKSASASTRPMNEARATSPGVEYAQDIAEEHTNNQHTADGLHV